jgi:hypothetical protein
MGVRIGMQEQVIREDTVITRSVDFATADMEDETVMVSIENGKYYGMDPVGSRIWELLSEPQSLADLVKALCGEYEVEPERCKADVLVFLNYLRGEDLVRLE